MPRRFLMKHVVRSSLIVVSDDEEVWKTMIFNETIPEWEKRRKNNLPPKMTAAHDKWFRIINGELKKEVWE